MFSWYFLDFSSILINNLLFGKTTSQVNNFNVSLCFSALHLRKWNRRTNSFVDIQWSYLFIEQNNILKRQCLRRAFMTSRESAGVEGGGRGSRARMQVNGTRTKLGYRIYYEYWLTAHFLIASVIYLYHRIGIYLSRYCMAVYCLLISIQVICHYSIYWEWPSQNQQRYLSHKATNDPGLIIKQPIIYDPMESIEIFRSRAQIVGT